jgi:exopolysaccharide production protein ExoZ
VKPATSLETIQAARGIAAIAVVLAHAGTVLGAPVAFRAGHAGVDFFFVLSGFIITWVHHRDVGHPSALRRYVWRRLIRIYPMYWFALALLMPLIALGIAQTTHPPLAATLLLLPQHQSPLLGVSWTLQHEMLFYLMFAIAILNRNAGIALFGVWLLLMLLGCIYSTFSVPWTPPSLLWDFLAAPYQLQFLLGMTVAAATLKDRVPIPRTMLAIGVIGFVTTAALEDLDLIAYLGLASQALFGIFSACAVAGMATAEERHLLHVNAPAALIGAASYTIYLVHYPAIALVRSNWIILEFPGLTAMVALSSVAIGTGIALHLAVERPILRWLRNLGVARHTTERLPHAARETA